MITGQEVEAAVTAGREEYETGGTDSQDPGN
jgi:hypothetical protein